jgi:hypothetical protein
VFSSNYTTPGLFFVVALCRNTAPTAASSIHRCTALLRHSGRNECPASLEAQPTTSTKAPSVNNLSLNNTFKVVTPVFQQIMTELSVAESEDRIVAITKFVLKL